MPNRKTLPIALVSAASILLNAVAYASEEESPFNSRIGWLDKCLAIRNHMLQPGTPVTIILFGWGHDPIVKGDATGIRIAGKILGRTDSGEICPALGEWRRGVNQQDGISFYEISLEEDRSFRSTDVGIGIIGLNADPANRSISTATALRTASPPAQAWKVSISPFGRTSPMRANRFGPTTIISATKWSRTVQRGSSAKP